MIQNLQVLFPAANCSVEVPTTDIHYACECLQEAMDVIVERIEARVAALGYASLDEAVDNLDNEICSLVFVLDQMDDVCCAFTPHGESALAAG